MLTKKQFIYSLLLPATCTAQLGLADEPIHDIDEVIVVGSRLQLNQQQLGSAITVLSAQDIQNIGAPYVSDVLRHVPGLAVSRTGPAGGLTQVRVRGSEANHVLVIIDGVEANSTNGEFDFSSLTTENIERIEVLRGPQSGVYGSNATAGVVNIVTANGGGQNTIDITVETGSLDLDKQSISLRGATGDIQGALSISHQSMAYNASEFGSERDKDENLNAFSKAQWQVNEYFRLSASGRYLFKDSDVDRQDFSGGPLQGFALDTAGLARTVEKSYQVAANWSLFDQAWSNTLSFDSSHFANESSSFSDSVADSGNKGSRKKLAFVSTYDFGEVNGYDQRASLFIENEKERYRNVYPFDASQVAEQDRQLDSVGLEYFINFNNTVSLTAALRQDSNDQFEDATTYRLSSRYNVSDNSNIHASIGTGVTNPSFFEQFGFVPGGYIGNPNLEPEEQSAWDLGWEQSWIDGQLQTDIIYFDSELENEIAGFTSPFNRTATSERSGIELSFSWQSQFGFALSGAYTYTDSSEDGVEELRRPENTLSLDGSIGALNNKLRINAGIVYNGEMIDTDFSTFLRATVDSYTLVNFSLNYEFSEQIETYLRVNNLFDQDYQEVIGFASPGVYGSAGIRFNF